jgi:hypothetical protein
MLAIDGRLAAGPRHIPGIPIQGNNYSGQRNLGMWLSSKPLHKANLETFQRADNQPVIAIKINAVFTSCWTRFSGKAGRDVDLYLAVFGGKIAGVIARTIRRWTGAVLVAATIAAVIRLRGALISKQICRFRRDRSWGLMERG